MKLTELTLRHLKPSEKRVRQSDGGGLFVDVMPSGSKIFRLAYRFGGKQRTLVIGEYPTVKLADARLKAAGYKQQLREGIDPAAAKQVEVDETTEPAMGPTWAAVANDYLALRKRSGAAPATWRKLKRQIGVTIDALGERELSTLTAEDVLAVVNPVACERACKTDPFGG